MLVLYLKGSEVGMVAVHEARINSMHHIICHPDSFSEIQQYGLQFTRIRIKNKRAVTTKKCSLVLVLPFSSSLLIWIPISLQGTSQNAQNAAERCRWTSVLKYTSSVQHQTRSTLPDIPSGLTHTHTQSPLAPSGRTRWQQRGNVSRRCSRSLPCREPFSSQLVQNILTQWKCIATAFHSFEFIYTAHHLYINVTLSLRIQLYISFLMSYRWQRGWEGSGISRWRW